MDEQTALVFGLQLVALFSIAGALLAYLLCKIRAPGGDTTGAAGEPSLGAGRAVIITSADTAIGLQVHTHTPSCLNILEKYYSKYIITRNYRSTRYIAFYK